MKNIRRNVLRGGGKRLKEIRQLLKLTPLEMAKKLGITVACYYKNENGVTFPRMATLKMFQKDLDISMDWMLFEKGPMYYREKCKTVTDENKLPGVVEMPEVKELLECMDKDARFRHKVLIYLYDYKDERKDLEAEPVQKDTEKHEFA
jgi:transcriptional regulator with XRE-family HTH domain